MRERNGGSWKIAFGKACLECVPSTKEEVEELCDHVTVAHNSMTRHDGHRPNQHVLGTDVPIRGMLGESSESMKSALEQGEDRYVKAQLIRTAARKAFLDADSEEKLRRAISRRSRPNRGPFEAGEQGPGRVVGKQVDKVWVMYGSKIYRCAPEQVRHVEHEVVELASWLPHELRTWRSTIRERGAGNVVELDQARYPPEEERETRSNDDEHPQNVMRGSDMSVESPTMTWMLT